jgi:hypothetical protein
LLSLGVEEEKVNDDENDDGYACLLSFDIEAVRSKLAAMSPQERQAWAEEASAGARNTHTDTHTHTQNQAWLEVVQAAVSNLARVTETQFRFMLEEVGFVCVCVCVCVSV